MLLLFIYWKTSSDFTALRPGIQVESGTQERRALALEDLYLGTDKGIWCCPLIFVKSFFELFELPPRRKSSGE